MMTSEEREQMEKTAKAWQDAEEKAENKRKMYDNFGNMLINNPMRIVGGFIGFIVGFFILGPIGGFIAAFAVMWYIKHKQDQ